MLFSKRCEHVAQLHAASPSALLSRPVRAAPARTARAALLITSCRSARPTNTPTTTWPNCARSPNSSSSAAQPTLRPISNRRLPRGRRRINVRPRTPTTCPAPQQHRDSLRRHPQIFYRATARPTRRDRGGSLPPSSASGFSSRRMSAIARSTSNDPHEPVHGPVPDAMPHPCREVDAALKQTGAGHLVERAQHLPSWPWCPCPPLPSPTRDISGLNAGRLASPSALRPSRKSASCSASSTANQRRRFCRYVEVEFRQTAPRCIQIAHG